MVLRLDLCCSCLWSVLQVGLIFWEYSWEGGGVGCAEGVHAIRLPGGVDDQSLTPPGSLMVHIIDIYVFIVFLKKVVHCSSESLFWIFYLSTKS